MHHLFPPRFDLHILFILPCLLFIQSCYDKGNPGTDSDTFQRPDTTSHQQSVESEETDGSDANDFVEPNDTESCGNSCSDRDTSSESDATAEIVTPDITIKNVEAWADCEVASENFPVINLLWEVDISEGSGTQAELIEARLSLFAEDKAELYQTLSVSPTVVELWEGNGSQHFKKTGADVIWRGVCENLCPYKYFQCDENQENCVPAYTDKTAVTFKLTLLFESNANSFESSKTWVTELNCG